MSFLLLLLLCSFSSRAQHSLIPNPAWPLDSVVNRSVHFYTVPGDRNYTERSTFVWNVYGGRLFFDADTLLPATDKTTASVPGDGTNTTRMWVVWNINTQLDTGYVYVYEISSDSCQLSDSNEKYKGMRIKISAPPKARFIDAQTIVCSDSDSGRVIMEIEGMPPYDLTYRLSYNGDETIETRHITSDDMADWDNDGEADNISFLHNNFRGITSDEVYTYTILSISSGGVPGKILPEFPGHTLIAHVQPTAPEIMPEWTEVTKGYDYTYRFLNSGVDPTQWYWALRDANSNLKEVRDWSATPNFQCLFNSTLDSGSYYLETQYQDSYGCLSPFARLDINVYNLPTIQFADDDTIINCSATSLIPDELIQIKVRYNGARKYGYTYTIWDPDGNPAIEPRGGTLDELNDWESTIIIENKFINDASDIRPWKVVISEAKTEDGRVPVDIVEGHDAKIIYIYPKPFIHDDIDFAN